MCHKTFDHVYAIVNSFVKRQSTILRGAIPVPKRVGVTGWWLRNDGSYRSIGQ